MKTIEIKCKSSHYLELSQLNHFQEGIKKLSQTSQKKLERRILEKGFLYPFFIWKDKAGIHNLLDGHQRLAVLRSLEKEGVEVPPLPVVYVRCQNLKEAKEEVLAISSQYGDWVVSELELYLDENEISLDDLNLTRSDLLDIDINPTEIDFSDKNALDAINEKEEQEEERVHMCPNCGHAFRN